MKAFRFSIFAALMVLLASCQEEIWPDGLVKEGVPTTIDFSISVPAADEVAVTKASVAASESEIRELMLIMFEAGGRKMVLDLKPYMDAGTVTEGYRKYTLTKPIDKDMYGGDVLSGTYRVYAIANWSSSFSSLSDLDQLTEAELKEQIATNPGFVYNISGTERFPMSSVTDNVVIELEGKSSLQIKLKRLVARIEFEFANGSNDENPNFLPSSYTIYNIPSQANLFSKSDNTVSGLTKADFGKSATITMSSKSFEFFMLENVQAAKQSGCNTQALRETWTGGTQNASTAPDQKNFTYAPDYGTFVVVNGSYTGKSYIGDVSYTIHLGNFSEKANTANGKDYSNFKVNRNERQKYKITINGVNSIVTEVTSDTEAQAGAEGALAETAKNVFVLDAHYEKVMMDLTGLGSPAYLFVDTPYCLDNNGEAQVDLTKVTKAQLDAMGLDYKWVKFMKPTSANDFPTYNSANAGDIHDLVNDIVAGTAKYYTVIDGKTMTAAFVEEFFYEVNPIDGSATDWTKFVNTDNRTMSIRPGISYSQDGNSSLVQNSHIELSQRSIKTTYAFDGKDPEEGAVYVPFGLETWDETGKNYFYGSRQSDNNWDPGNLTDDNGWNNTKTLTNGVLPSNTSKAGYLTSVSDNSKESHVYTSYSGAHGYNACLLRNRDENNDGKIGDDELKWYLPAIDQYVNIWLSEDQLHEDTQLFDRNKINSIDNTLNKASVFYTSSSTNSRLYWAYEGASYGKDWGSTISNATNGVRCVRNLVSPSSTKVYSGAPSKLALNDEDNRIISVDNVSAVRKIDHVGEYGAGHTERMQDNLLPRAFEVARVYLGENLGSGEFIEIPEKIWLVLNNDKCDGDRNSSTNYDLTLSISPTTGNTYVCNGIELNTQNNYTHTFTSNRTNKLDVVVTKTNGNSTESKTITVTFEFSNSWFTYTYDDVDYDGVEEARKEYTNQISTGKGNGTKDSFGTKSSFASIIDVCATGYYQEYDKSDLGMWRVPNQRELLLMLNLQTEKVPYVLASTSEVCTSSTYMTNFNKFSDKEEPYATYSGGMSTDTQSAKIYIRCVRDAQVVGGDDTPPVVTPPVVTPPDPGTGEGDEA